MRYLLVACLHKLSASSSKHLKNTEMLKAYDSDAFSSEESDNKILQSQEKEINSCTVRQVYLITYSQADEARFQTIRSFVYTVLFSFHNTPAKVVP